MREEWQAPAEAWIKTNTPSAQTAFLGKHLMFWERPEEFNAILSEFSAHVTWPGNREMPLHIDQWFMPHPVDPIEDYPRTSDVSRSEQKCGDPVTARHPINPPVVCNVMFAITDFTVENGATRLVPGSHRSGLHPAPDRDYDVFYAEVPAGGFVVWEGRTWHAASLNTGDSPRVGITTYWSAPFIRHSCASRPMRASRGGVTAYRGVRTSLRPSRAACAPVSTSLPRSS